MKISLARALFAAVASLTLLICVWIYSYDIDESFSDDIDDDIFIKGEIGAKNVIAECSTDEKILWRAKMGSMFSDWDMGDVSGRQIEVVVDSQVGETRVEGDEGNFDVDTRQVTLEKNVKVYTAAGHQLLTEKIIWSDEQQKFLTDVEFTLIKENEKIIGKQLEADPDFKNIKIKNVVGELEAD